MIAYLLQGLFGCGKSKTLHYQVELHDPDQGIDQKRISKTAPSGHGQRRRRIARTNTAYASPQANPPICANQAMPPLDP